jgi:predicted nucleotidyltransferase
MVEMSDIYALADRIVQEFQPERIILFGSYAYGTPTPDSDVDLLVIMPHEGKAIYKAIEILKKVKPSFGIDLIVRSPEELEQRLAWNDFFLREITEKGQVLHAAAYA